MCPSYCLTALVTVLGACSKNDNGGNAANTEGAGATTDNTSQTANNTGKNAPDPVTLKMMLFGDKPADLDKVLAEFEKRTKDTLNTKLEIEWNTNADHKQKSKLKLAAGEEIDAIFDAPWMNLNQNVSQGFYQELDKYFNNDEYPGLKKAFTPEFLESNKINGHTYAIPITNFFYDMPVVFIRKDLREKLGLQPIKSYDELEVYLQKVKEQNPSMLQLPLKGDRGFYKMFGPEGKMVNVRTNPNTISGTGVAFNLALSADGKKVIGATTLGDPTADYANFPAPFNTPDYYYSNYDKFVEWNKYVQKDVLNEKDPGSLFTSGKAAAFEGTINDMTSKRQKLQTAVPGADVEFFVYNTAMRNMEAGAIPTDFKAWNDIVIPVTSKNADRTMKFFDWLFSSQENHDLLELGIEGEHWTADGDKGYKSTAKTTNYLFPAYEMTWNPLMSRINAENDADSLKVIEYQAKNESYYQVPLSGFVFNAEPVKNEIAKVQPKSSDAVMIFNAGLDKNWRTSAEKLNKELRASGLETIRAELIKQVQAYIDNGGK